MVIKNMSKREKALAIATLALFCSVVLYGFIIEPVISSWMALSDEVGLKKSQAAKDIILVSKLKELEAEYRSYPELLKKTGSEDEARARVLGEIEKAAKASQCNVSNIKPRESKDRVSYREMIFDVMAEGSIAEFSKFLYEIETSAEFLRVKRFTLTSQTGPAGRLKGIFLISKVVIS